MKAVLKSRIRRLAMINATLLCLLCVSVAQAQSQYADRIFTGEHIITMDDSPVTAVAIGGDRIIAVGDELEVMQLQGENTQLVALGEQALLPGFIDAHGHFAGVSRYLDLMDLSSPPIGTVSNVEDIVLKIRLRIEEMQIPEGQLIYGFGYDDSLLAEQRHPNREDLDRASTDHPIVIRHVSGHLLAANSLALEQAGITSITEDPPGGLIRRRAGSQVPDGVLEETAMGFFPGTGELLSADRQIGLRREAVDIYASYGITTIQDSNVSMDYVEMLKAEGRQKTFAADIVAIVMANPLTDQELATVTHDSEYEGGVRIGGVKFTLDGSPQGRTAWLSQPYTAGPRGAAANYVAYPSYDPQAWLDRIKPLIARGMPVLAHANGDAAIELMIDGVESAVDDGELPDHRSVIIHAQLIRNDQLDRVAALGIIPSYFSAHPFFWGDWHRLSFGDERASFISPIRATIDRGIPWTIHNDAPIVPPDMMRLVAITVNRETRSGYVLGPEQRATVEEVLQAITLRAAYQYFEEDEKGSITPGKRADLVILEQNPLLVDPSQLASIQVVETIARGRTIFSRR
ncbi:MAG: amidohydrolase [Gammaproteobacteria bacterium]|nr:amidohydrolase [Gammaproteobacteria bacterium]MCY4356811.1 amidohydrolase [Gammaproteobacteria bacterium]